MTSMNEREVTVHCSAEEMHRKSQSAATSQLGMRAVSNPFTFGILKRTTLPVYTPSKEDLSVMEASGPKAEQRIRLEHVFVRSMVARKGPVGE